MIHCHVSYLCLNLSFHLTLSVGIFFGNEVGPSSNIFYYTKKQNTVHCCRQASLAKWSAFEYTLTIQNRTGAADFQSARSFISHYIKKIIIFSYFARFFLLSFIITV